MSNIVLGINQGDFIYYYNLSTGDVDRDWLFPGGTPTGGTGYLPAIQYNSVNLTGYDARLTVTGYGGVQRTELKSKIIVVYPEVFSVSMSITPSNTGMGSPVEYLFTGGTGSGVASYSWTIPELGGVTGATLSSVTYTAEDWYTLTGTFSGSPNASFITSGTLACISNVGNNSTTSSAVTYRKIGPDESVNYWRQGGTGIYATSGQYYDPNIFPFTTSAIGIGGNNIILQIDQNPYYPLCWNNAHFHSTDEVAYFYPNNIDAGGSMKFRMLLSGSILDSMGVLYGTSSEISLGNYIKPGDVHSKLDDSVYLTDYLTTGGGGLLTSLSAAIGTGNRDWSDTAIIEYLTNYYYASGSSKYIETGGYTSNKTPVRNLVSVVAYGLGMQGYNWGGTGGTPPSNFHGVSILSSQGGDDLYGSSATMDIAIELYDFEGTVLDSGVIVLSDGGDPGNSYDGRMILAQDTPYNTGLGIKSLMNNHFAFNGWDDYLVVEEAEWFAPYQNGGSTTGPRYNSNEFHGLRLSIKEPLFYGTDYIQSIIINWGPGYSTFLASVSGTIPINQYNVLASPFASTTTSKTSKQSWTGIPYFIYPPNSSNYQDYYKGWQYGGSL
jgi:hypothetical protein